MAICLKGISNQDLTSRLKDMVRKERELTHRIVLHLAEVNRRRLYAEQGYPSLFEYACKALGYSRSSAQRRIVAARIVAKFPEVYECLEDGRLSLRALEVAADALDRPNAKALLCELWGKSRDEALKIVAYHLPIEPRKLADKIVPVVRAATRTAEVSGQLNLLTQENGNYSRAGVITNSIGNEGLASVEQDPTEAPLQFRFEFTADASLKEKVERAWELIECYDLETVMHKALDEYLARHCPIERNKRRKAREERKLAKQGQQLLNDWETVAGVTNTVVDAMTPKERELANPRFASAKLRDEILERDGYQCMYVAEDGTRCTARDHLQIDHIVPWAQFGKTEASNLRTMCRAHNHLLARKWYGPINRNKPLTMHVDLNSAYATIEQQANPLLRGKPLVVAAYNSPRGCIVAPSIEAKKFGIKTGMRIMEARLLCKDIVVRTPDPDKYFDVNIRLRKIFKDYTPDFHPKSIDEFVLNFASVEKLTPDLVKISYEIKRRLREDIGDWMKCNIGIGTNRFLAKLAASLHKPDGLDVINHENLLDIYSDVSLIDLNGINVRFQARLNSEGIFTPIDFLNSRMEILQKQVFKSIVGRYWYERLRGYEVDDIEFETKSIGQDYAIPQATNEPQEIAKLIMKLCEKMGRRLRGQGLVARGIHVALVYDDWTYWHRGRMQEAEMYTTKDLFTKAILIFNQRPDFKKVSKLSVSCYGLSSSGNSQSSLFDFTDEIEKNRKVSDAMDEINNKYGEFVITPALMMGMNNQIIKRVPFGNVKELENLYGENSL